VDHADAVATVSATTERPRRQSLIDGIRRFKHALLPSKDTSRSTPQSSPLPPRRTLEVEREPVTHGSQAKRPSTSSEG